MHVTVHCPCELVLPSMSVMPVSLMDGTGVVLMTASVSPLICVIVQGWVW